MDNLLSQSFTASHREPELEECDRFRWLLELQPGARADWRARLQWVRLVDYLAEEQLLQGDDASLVEHFVVPRDPESLGVSWCEAWQRYVVAVHRYLQPKVIVPDVDAHREMLLELGGNVFCLLPDVDWSIRRAIAHFGALDQFFTQLNQLQRDLRQGRCHIPLHVLASFGLSPRDLVSGSCRTVRGYLDMMRYWLDEYLPTLRFEAAEFSQLQGLPPALRLMRDACLQRHDRIERVFRACRFDFVRAEAVYWSEVAASCSVHLAVAS